MSEGVQAAKVGIESLEYIDDLVREYLLFRGFNETLQAMERDLEQDHDRGFRAEQIVDELLEMASELRVGELLERWKYLSCRFFSHLSPKYSRTTRMFEKRLIRLFLVSAAAKGRKAAIREFMSEHGRALGQQGGDWIPWLGLEYIEEPEKRPEFEAYFSAEWRASLRAALADFVQTVFPAMALPRILLFDKDRREREALERKVRAYEEHVRGETRITALDGPDSGLGTDAEGSAGPVGLVEDHIGGAGAVTSPRMAPANEGAADGVQDVIQADEPGSVLRISQEDIFLEHNAGISLARFSASGERIASYDDESVLKIWSPDPASSAAKLKNELDFSVHAMAWDRRHEHLLYLYDEGGCIRTLNANTNLMSRHAVFSRRHPWIQCMLAGTGSSSLLTVCSAKPESTGDVAVQLWDASASKAAASRRLSAPGEPQGVSAALNHNGTLAALAFSNGHVQLVDARSLETVSTIKTRRRDVCAAAFSADEDSLMIATETGGLTQWSLRSSGQMLAESTLAIAAQSDRAAADSRLDSDRVAFTPDRETVAVAPCDQCLLFSVDSAALVDSTRRHKELVTAIDVAADRLLSASEDGTVRVARWRKV
ncbi:hypothetical protein GGF46_001450 [Coemansia sp. RSA 552]|nr:hypothetical protein GGF46_001450 [Coemansia sp. RSA 552]